MKAWLLAGAAIALVACGPERVTKPMTIPRRPPPPAEPVGDAKPEPPPPVVAREVWWGTIALPNDLIDIVVTFTGDGAAPAATFAVPAMKVENITLGDVTRTADALAFTLSKQPPYPSEHYRLARRGDIAEGTMTMAGSQLYVRMVRQEPGAPARVPIARPQTPLPPYPYAMREVRIAAPADGSLAGTLTIPAGTGPFPAALLITGSGVQDRDQNVYGHRTFRVIADHLTRAGFVVLRVDDRGAGGSKGKLGTLETDVGDARAAFEWLMLQPEVDGKRVGLIGHSLGALVAPIIAARTREVAFVVALAAPGVPGWELIPMQVAAMGDAAGVKPEVAKRLAAAQRAVGQAMVRGKPGAARAALRASLAEAAAVTGAELTDAELDATVAAKLPELEDPWTLSFFKEDPRAAWRKVKAPVLALWGEKDLQVPPARNQKEVAAALKKARNKDVTIKTLPGLNHLYQHAPTGTVEEYARLEETFDLQTLRAIESWMSERMKKK